MRRKIYLYIGSELCDLADDSFVLMNYRREDLESPAAVLNSWSQSIDLPRTGKNSAILGHYYRLDHTTTGAGGTGVNFNALKRTPFTIYDTLGRRVQSGYIKLEKVTRDAFSVTLFGGLGGMFYALTYAAGSSDKLTLADLKYNWAGGTWYAATGIAIPSTVNALADAWSALLNYGAPSSGTKWDIINFAPALNGTQYPFKFDTNKAIAERGTSGQPDFVVNLYDSKTDGGVTYRPKKDSYGNYLPLLIEMGNKHNEWEAQDLRTYCQRPVISMRKLVEAIIKYAADQGYTLTVDSRFYSASCDYFEKVWMTLPFLNRDNYTVAELAGLSLADYLAGTDSPADYLLAIAKTFGFVFLPENDGTTFKMMLRDTFYGSPEHIDITPRVDRAFEVQPLNIGSRFYEWKPTKVFGGFAADYEKRNGRIYGSQRVDTGYDFNAEVQNVIEGNVFNGCNDLRDANLNYDVIFGEYTYLLPPYDRIRKALNYAFKFAFTDTVKWDLYHYDAYGQIDGTVSCEPTQFVIPQIMDYDGYGMFYDLPQFCNGDGKSEDGNNVLLFFEGSQALPEEVENGETISEVIFHISEDQEEAVTMLNGGVPCWDMRYSGTGIQQVGAVPSFRRWHYSGGAMVASLDYGDPTEVAVRSSFVTDKNIYVNYWSNYIADRLDANTSVLRAYVNLEGWDVGEALFRNFYYYGGSVWALNAIENYSLTTADTTLCEFVRVNDTDNYNNGQL